MGGDVLRAWARVLRRVQWRRRATGLPSRRKPRSRRPAPRRCARGSATAPSAGGSPSRRPSRPRPPRDCRRSANASTPPACRPAPQRAARRRGRQNESLRPFAHGERAFAEAAQQTKEQPAREPHVARHIGFKRKDGIGHERSLLLTGWLYSGTRFSHSRSACQ